MAEQKPLIPAPDPQTGWSLEHLGAEKYQELAVAYGCFDPRQEPSTYRPPLGLAEAYRAQQAAAGSKKAKE
jgi:hypothetical protein